MAGLIYASATDHLNMARYMCVVPAHYSPVSPEGYVEGLPDLDIASAIPGLKTPGAGNGTRPGGRGFFDEDNQWAPVRTQVDPIYTPMFADARTRSMITIAQMIDMYVTKVQFEIPTDRDVMTIFHSLDSYALEVERMVSEGNQEVIRYLRKVYDFRSVMYQRFRRVLNLHPDYKEAYYKGTEKIKLLFDLFFTISKDSKFDIDPIGQLRNPPYKLPVAHEVNADATNGVGHQAQVARVGGYQTPTMTEQGGSGVRYGVRDA